MTCKRSLNLATMHFHRKLLRSKRGRHEFKDTSLSLCQPTPNCKAAQGAWVGVAEVRLVLSRSGRFVHLLYTRAQRRLN